jgi:hypothetical protein
VAGIVPVRLRALIDPSSGSDIFFSQVDSGTFKKKGRHCAGLDIRNDLVLNDPDRAALQAADQ